MLAGMAVGVLLLLAAPGIRSRAAGAVLLFACQVPGEARLPEGAFRLDVLDVGQGLSTVIRTRRHVLIYDTGAAYPSGFNLADSVLLPWLRHQGIGHADMLVLSHGDNDHAGAAARLHAKLPIARVFSGEPARVAVSAGLCPSRYYWRWDGVTFGFIQPPEAAGYRGNNASCVLRVAGPGGQALLTGDAEQRIERMLAPRLRRQRPVDAVVAGHHGSSTSSSPAFVRALRATHVIYSAGYRNRYGFPRADVDRRWRDAGARRWRSDGCGTLGLVFGVGPRPVVEAYAPRHRHYWQPADTVCEMTAPAPSSMIRRSVSH
jgi:competence protein ComEC